MRPERDEAIARLVREALAEEGIGILPEALRVPVSVSGRHLHLSAGHMAALFGEGAALIKEKDISQPGQFASRQFVALEGPAGRMERLRVLGPLRKHTQVELALSEARRLGLQPPTRASGDIKGSAGARLIGPAGSVLLAEGVIIAERHVHMTPEQAALWGFSDGEMRSVRLDTPRGGVLDRVFIRVGADYALDMHVDTDDANAFQIPEGCEGIFLEAHPVDEAARGISGGS